MPTFTTTNPDSLVVGFRKYYTDEFDSFEAIWPSMYSEVATSTRAYEEVTGMTGLGLVPEIAQGATVAYDDTIPTFKTRFDHKKYGLGFQITEEAMEDDQYGLYGTRMSRALARSMAETIQIHATLPWNRGFDGTNYPLADGKAWFATDHPQREAPDFRNTPSVAADISGALIEQALLDIGSWVNHRGLKINMRARTLWVAPANEFLARRILESQLIPSAGVTSGHMNSFSPNDINPVRGRLELRVNPYFTDDDAIFVQCTEGFAMWFWRKKPTFDKDNDFETTNLRMATRGRWSYGVADPRGWWGCPGV